MSFTKFRSYKLDKGLYLEERPRMVSYRARALLSDGRQKGYNTDTADFRRAELRARSWFRALKQSDRNESSASMDTSDHSMFRAAKLYFLSIEDEKKRANAEERWETIKDFFRDVDAEDIGSKLLKTFLAKRREKNKSISASTLHKDLVCIRQILKTAVLEEWISSVPLFPSTGKIKSNPQPWLEEHEWRLLQKTALSRIADKTLDERSRRRRQELWNFCVFMVNSCCRVDEVYALRVSDCRIVFKQTLTNGKPSAPIPGKKPQRYLELRVTGKTGYRKAIAWAPAIFAFESQQALNGEDPSNPDGAKPNQLLFPERHRDAFRELLDEAGLRNDVLGRPRNLKCLRCTALMLRIKKNPAINLKLLAENAGTSVAMLDQFYLKPLKVDLGIEELI